MADETETMLIGVNLLFAATPSAQNGHSRHVRRDARLCLRRRDTPEMCRE